MPPPPPVPVIPPPPHHVFPTPRNRSRFAAKAAAHTTALVGIGHVGTRYATDVVLQFQAEASRSPIRPLPRSCPDGWAAQHGLLPLRSRVGDHRQFLLRPDLGRRLDDASLDRLRREARRGVDVQPILADGLSAAACMGSGIQLLERFTASSVARGFTVGTPMCARFARVWLEDEIGQEVGAKVAVILLGERPGLGTGDGLSAYLVHAPRVGLTDGDRNMMSNIHARGTPPAEAAERLAVLAGRCWSKGNRAWGSISRVSRASSATPRAVATGRRSPRERLVEVDR